MKDRIMVIDDDEDIRELVACALEEEGYSLLVSSDGNNAWRTLGYLTEDALPACIILDLVMPGIDGVDVLDKIRHGPIKRLRHIPVILATGLKIPREDFQSSTNVYLLEKPFNLEQLFELINKIFCKNGDGSRADNDSP